MSLDLKDFRGKLTVEGWSAIDAEAQVTGKDRAEIVRDIVHAWALERIETARLLNITLVREGALGIDGERE